MVRLHRHDDYHAIVELDETSGSTRPGRPGGAGEVAGFAFVLKDGRIAASYRTSQGHVFQVGAQIWRLAEAEVQCRYFRLLRWEFFSIGSESAGVFRTIATYPMADALRWFEPATDRLDWDAPFFFGTVWRAWLTARAALKAQR